jgi:hypothetical protein
MMSPGQAAVGAAPLLAAYGLPFGFCRGGPNASREDSDVATLSPNQSRGVVLLTREQQEILTTSEPKIFAPVPGRWGQRGSTIIDLECADETTVRSALVMAWRNKAPKSLNLPWAERTDAA